MTTSPTVAPIPSPAPSTPSPMVQPTPSPTSAPTSDPILPQTPYPTLLPTPSPSSPPTSSPSTDPTTPTPTGVPTMPTASPVPAPTVTVLSDAPRLDSAVLSDTQSAFSLTFSSTCYCAEETGSVENVAVCGFDIQSEAFDQGCDINRMLDESTLYTFGNQSTCHWSEDSLTAVVTYDVDHEGLWLTGKNVTLAGGYILGAIPPETDVLEYAAGTVALQGRTAAPNLLEAKFTDDGGSILVTFSPEGSATSGLLNAKDPASGSGPGSCGALLNASSIEPLGDGPTCEWTERRELSIVPGHDAYVVPDKGHGGACASSVSCITLLDGGITTEAFAILSSVGSTPVLVPDSPPAVSAVLVAPQTVGLCGLLKLDGRASSGALSRSLSSFWNVSAPLITSASLNASLALFQGSLVAELNATSLEAGIEHTFTLTVENFLGDYDEATVKVTRIAEDVPSVVVLGAASRTVTRSRSISFRMQATPPACGEQRQLLTCSWSEAGGNGYNELGTDVFQGLEQVDVTTLTLPVYTLGYPGSSYLFVATATSQTSEASSSTTVEVVVEQGAVRASIQGGHFRQHTVGRDLVLDGSDSLDEDDISELSLRYDWSCTQNCSTLQEDWTTNDDGSIVMIPSQGLESGTIYEFSLTVSTGSADSGDTHGLLRSDNVSIRVQVISYEAPEVFVVAKDTALKHDPTQKVVVYGSAGEQASPYDTLWTQVAGDLDLQEQAWGTFFGTAQSGLNLVIRANVLTGGSTYTFRLSATDATSQTTGFAELSVIMNAAPTGGSVDASPRAGLAATDMFTLESLGWTDEVDDLPLMFSFAYINGQDESEQQRGLSMFASESPEWDGSLPLGPATSNYTMLIVGHVSDTYGATSTSTRDDKGTAVTVRVTGWNFSPGDSTLLETYATAREETKDTPGRTTTIIRAYSSLLAAQVDEAPLHLSVEADLYLELLEVMVSDVASDFRALECSVTTIGATIDTLALVSGVDISQRPDSKVAVLSSSAGVLDRALGEGTWDSQTFSPVLELLDNVLGGFNASGGVIGREDLGDTAAELLQGMMKSMISLMESDLEDGEDAMVIENEYIRVLCLVTSTTNAMDFDTEMRRSVKIEETITSSTNLMQCHKSPPGGNLAWNSVDVAEKHFHFSIHKGTPTLTLFTGSSFGRPSNEVDAGVTSITITTANDDQGEVTLSAPVRMTMRGSMGGTTSRLPSCVYYNDDAGSWDTAGLAMGASIMSVDDVGGENSQAAANITVTCVSFHLSDFTIATDDEADAAFRPIQWTGGLAVLSKVRDISMTGMMLLLMVVLLLVIAWVASRIADARDKLDRQLAGKTDSHYILTGEPLRYPTLLSDLSEPVPSQAHLRDRRHRVARRRSRKRGLQVFRRQLLKRFRVWGCRAKIVLRLVLRWHPWFGIVSPSSSSLVLTREQLSVIIFAQIMVHMMVKALVIGNSSNYRIRVANIIVSSVISMPASIIIPKLFAAASAPPPSETTNHGRRSVAPYMRDNLTRAQNTAQSKTDSSPRWIQDSNTMVAAYHLVLATASAGSRATRAASAAHAYAGGGVVDRGTNLVLSGLCQMMLELACIGLASAIRIDGELDKSMLFTTVGSFIASIVYLDAILSTRKTSFSIINFKVVFALVFTRMVLTALQVVFAVNGVRNRESSVALYAFILAVSLVKIIWSHTSELTPCMDGMNESFMAQISMAKVYRPPPSVGRGHKHALKSDVDVCLRRHSAAIKIQTVVRMHQAQRRTIRREEVLVWHCPEVGKMRQSIRFQASACLVIYTSTVVWINLCYVATYDSAAVRSWLTATGFTVLADILLRKPLSVLATAVFYTIRDTVRVPQDVYVGTGRSHRPVVNF
ncbi:unnamed protein product [Scytosiphon promiscuus]